jgi:hypothetical protein
LNWLVGFLPSPNRGVYRMFAGKSHCFCFRYDPSHCRWVLVEHSVVGLDVRILAEYEAERLIHVCLANGSLLSVKGGTKTIVQRPPVLMTCTEVVKSQLGIRDWRIWTPGQLKSALLKRGARSF